ncbi:MAG: phosphoglycerate mutase family protein [Bdellovibrionota bacterium]
MVKTLIIVRHAHRDKRLGSDANNGLSPKGKGQAIRIAKYYKKRFGEKKTPLFSSPKLRCIETLYPIAKLTKKKIVTLDLLDEQQGSSQEYAKQIHEFLEWWEKEAPQTTIVCSHGDWIPQFTKKILETPIDLAKGGWIEIVKEDSAKPQLVWVLQDFKDR